MNPYIGYSPTEEEDEYECPHCRSVFSCWAAVKRHVILCPKNDDFDHEVFEND